MSDRDYVGEHFATSFTLAERETAALVAGALEIETDIRLHPDIPRMRNTGCDRRAVVDELLPITATERACERIRELETQLEILRAMWKAPRPIAMCIDTQDCGRLYVVRDDGVVLRQVFEGDLAVMQWRQVETVPGTPADLAEQFSKHPNLKTS